MSYLGDFAEDATLVFKFNTMGQDFAPITLVDGALAVYKQGSTAESTAGVTLVTDYDSRTGLHNVTIDTSADAFYETGKDYSVVFTAGTADGVSLVGRALRQFSIENRPVPWNAAWDAEVQSEVQDAIEANHLDHLLAAAYDPASKPGNASGLLNVLVENDGGTPRYTANALEQSPSGGGSTTVVVYPLQSTVSDRVSASTIQAYYMEDGWPIGPTTVVDGNLSPIDLTAYDSLKLIIQDQHGTDLLVTTSVTVSGDDNNQWTATGTSAVTATVPARHPWTLRGISTGVDVVLGRGIVKVDEAAQADA